MNRNANFVRRVCTIIEKASSQHNLGCSSRQEAISRLLKLSKPRKNDQLSKLGAGSLDPDPGGGGNSLKVNITDDAAWNGRF